MLVIRLYDIASFDVILDDLFVLVPCQKHVLLAFLAMECDAHWHFLVVVSPD